MDKYGSTAHLDDAGFRRLTGIRRETFEIMLGILSSADALLRRRGGPKPRLIVADRLLLALEYMREYRTYFHVGQSYGVSESQAQRIHRWVEDTLLQDERFHLPGKKTLLVSDAVAQTVVIDASDTPVERPKKDNGAATRARRSAIR